MLVNCTQTVLIITGIGHFLLHVKKQLYFLFRIRFSLGKVDHKRKTRKYRYCGLEANKFTKVFHSFFYFCTKRKMWVTI